MNKRLRIAIDGPAAAGKSTVAKRVAEKLHIIYIDTGAMYRAFTLKALINNIAITDEKALCDLLNDTSIELTQENQSQKVLLDGIDVSKDIRSSVVSNNVSYLAQHPSIRHEMAERQRELAKNENVVMDGRDIGTNVIPDAEVKIFLIASVEERAKRRFAENKRKGQEITTLEALQKEISERDMRDETRANSPLKKADDAIAIDTTSMTIDQVVNEIMSIISKMREN